MIRKLMLLIGTAGGLLAAFLVYQSLTGEGGMLSRRMPSPPQPPTFDRPPQDEWEPGIPKVDEVHIVRRDDQGRLQTVYDAQQWTKQPDESYHMTRPHMEVYLRDGGKVYVDADEGTIYAEDTGTKFEPRRGSLVGNVRILIDRGVGPDLPPPDERPDDVIRIHVDDLKFNNDLLTLETDHQVELWSPQADVRGRGLYISWNESPRELRLLRIEQGQSMVIYGQQELDIISLPGAASQAGTAPTPTGPTDGAVKPDAAPSGPGAAEAAARDADKPPGDSAAPAVAPTTRTADVPETEELPSNWQMPQPADPPVVDGEPAARNVYLATFHKNVRVRSAERSMTGVDTLSVLFEWDREAMDRDPSGRAASSTRPPRRQRASDETRSQEGRSAGPTTSANRARPSRSRPGAATTAPADGQAGPAQPASSGPASPAAPVDPNASQPIELFWDGQLVIQPKGYTPQPSRQRYTIVADGDAMEMADRQMQAQCKRFIFLSPGQIGRLEGDANAPARLTLDGGEQVVCRQMDFDRLAGKAYLSGAGQMAGTSDPNTPLQAGQAAFPTALSGERDGQITWDKLVILEFSEQSATGQDGPARLYPEVVSFYGNVHLTARPGDPNAAGDEVRAKRLDVHLVPDPWRKYRPSRAVAIGEVHARQGAQEIQAHQTEIRFASVADSDANQPPQIEPEWLQAVGNVRFADRSDANEPVTAECDVLTTGVRAGWAELTGEPATVVSGDRVIRGPLVRLEQPPDPNRPQTFLVDGPGELAFTTDRDLEGNPLPDPRPVVIGWQRRMDFDGGKDQASFRQDVKLSSGPDRLQSQQLDIHFERVAKAVPSGDEQRRPAGPASRGTPESGRPAPASRPAEPVTRPTSQSALARGASESVTTQATTRSASTTAPAGPGEEGLAGDASQPPAGALGGRLASNEVLRPVRIVARQDVTLRARRFEGEGDQRILLGQIHLTGGELIYKVDAQAMDVNGPGTLLLEDFRPPGSETGAAAGVAGRIQSPSQTGFLWREQMSFDQSNPSVTILGNAQMQHLSGDHVELTPAELPLPDWPELGDGRRIDIWHAQTLRATFVQADPADPASGSGLEGWVLEQFTAQGRVLMEDGPYEGVCERLMYDRQANITWLEGYVQGQSPAEARLSYKDRAGGRVHSWASPKITVYRTSSGDRVETESVRATGGR